MLISSSAAVPSGTGFARDRRAVDLGCQMEPSSRRIVLRLLLSRMYGGGTHLFYADGGQDYVDGESVVDGVICRVWRHDRLGMHARDLNLLADVLEKGAKLSTVSALTAAGTGQR